MGRFLTSLGKDRRGATVVEFALASVLLALMLAGMVDLGLGLYSQSRVDAAAQMGVRYAQANGFDQQGVSQAIVSGSNVSGLAADPAPSSFCGCFSSGRISEVACTADCSQSRPAGRYVRASARATYQPFLAPPGFPSSYTLTSTAVARVQ